MKYNHPSKTTLINRVTECLWLGYGSRFFYMKTKKEGRNPPFGTPLIGSRSSVSFNPFSISDKRFHVYDLLAFASFGHIIEDLRLINFRSTSCPDRLGLSEFTWMVKVDVWPNNWQLHPITKNIP